MFLQYGMAPPDLPEGCNVCSTKFTLVNPLYSKNFSLIIILHNKLMDIMEYLHMNVFTPLNVYNDPVSTLATVCRGIRPLSSIFQRESSKQVGRESKIYLQTRVRGRDPISQYVNYRILVWITFTICA